MIKKELFLIVATILGIHYLCHAHQKVALTNQVPQLLHQDSHMKQIEWRVPFKGKKQSPNFLARYVYGNKQNVKGIKNIHLNIRSLTNKVTDVKQIISDQKPHIFGLSECELKKINGQFDEGRLKIPGYDTLYPKSWSKHGFARVIVYVKRGLEYEQISDLEHEDVQTIWLKGGFRNCKNIYFCHMYREHTSTIGASLVAQRKYLEVLLSQWEKALSHNQQCEVNEIHISGDMNLDALDNRWLRKSYYLYSLSEMVY